MTPEDKQVAEIMIRKFKEQGHEEQDEKCAHCGLPSSIVVAYGPPDMAQYARSMIYPPCNEDLRKLIKGF